MSGAPPARARAEAAQDTVLAAAALRGEAPPWPGGGGAREGEAGHGARFLDRCAWHGVIALLHARLAHDAALRAAWPAPLREAIGTRARAEAARELLQRREALAVLDALAAAGVHPLLLKGTPLAYSHYDAPHLRPRGDVDLLVGEDERAAALHALERIGYARTLAVHGALVSAQAGARRIDPLGAVHTVDLHWRVSNKQLFAPALGRAELVRDARALPALGPHARAPAPPHALLLASLHRAAHRHTPYRAGDTVATGGDRLIWLEDVRLLAARMTRAEWERTVALAIDRGLAAVSLDALDASRARLGASVPGDLRAALGAVRGEPAARWLRSGPLRGQLLDLAAAPGWRGTLRLLREHLLPAPAYMRARYPQRPRAWLPALYVRRGIAGTVKRLRRGAGREHP